MVCTCTKVPYRFGDYNYYHRTVQEKSYRINCRIRVGVPGAQEEVLTRGVYS